MGLYELRLIFKTLNVLKLINVNIKRKYNTKIIYL